MANTTNYNWETPDDTDLVKDGAAAIRTLGSSVDTTTKALNPSTTLGDIEYRSATANTNTRLGIGTTGQVLTVAGGVPTWATSDDANAIQNALLTTTGDTIYASSASTPARLGIGTTGQVLTVAAGIPSWATPASSTPTFVGVSLTKSAVQSCANNTGVKITWDTENFDTDAFHDPSTNTSRITIPSGKAGKYSISATGSFSPNATGQRYFALYVNNVLIIILGRNAGTSVTDLGQSGTAILNLAVGDYVELEAFQNSGGALNFSDTYSVLFSAQYLGA